MLLANNAYKSIKRILKDLKESKGADAVKSWGSDFGMDFKHCKVCEDKTPVLHSPTTYECGVCYNKLNSEGRNDEKGSDTK